MLMNVLGLDVIVTESAVEFVLDWSNCRSPSRAKRRHKRGFQQRVVRFDKPSSFLLQNKLYVHPTIVPLLIESSNTLSKMC